MADYEVHLVGDEPESAIILEGVEVAFNAMGWLIFHKEFHKEQVVAIFQPGVVKFVLSGSDQESSSDGSSSVIVAVN